MGAATAGGTTAGGSDAHRGVAFSGSAAGGAASETEVLVDTGVPGVGVSGIGEGDPVADDDGTSGRSGELSRRSCTVLAAICFGIDGEAGGVGSLTARWITLSDGYARCEIMIPGAELGSRGRRDQMTQSVCSTSEEVDGCWVLWEWNWGEDGRTDGLGGGSSAAGTEGSEDEDACCSCEGGGSDSVDRDGNMESCFGRGERVWLSHAEPYAPFCGG